MKIKKSKVLGYFGWFDYCLKSFKQSKFLYGITKNKTKLKDESEAINKASEEYNKENGALLEKYGEKDSKGKMIVNPGGSIPLTDGKAYNAEMDALKVKYKSLFDLLEEEIEVDFHHVDYSECPPDLGGAIEPLEEIGFFMGNSNDIPSMNPVKKEEEKKEPK